MQKVPSLFPTKHGSLQRKVTGCIGERIKAGLASNEDYVNQFQVSRRIVKSKIAKKISLSDFESECFVLVKKYEKYFKNAKNCENCLRMGRKK